MPFDSLLWNASSQMKAGMKRQNMENQEVCAHRQSVCLVWGSSNVNHITYLNLWLWKVNAFFMCAEEEVHLGISHKASLWAAGHNFRQVIYTGKHRYERREPICICVCLFSKLEEISDN